MKQTLRLYIVRQIYYFVVGVIEACFTGGHFTWQRVVVFNSNLSLVLHVIV
jgi:hypothetical protein